MTTLLKNPLFRKVPKQQPKQLLFNLDGMKKLQKEICKDKPKQCTKYDKQTSFVEIDLDDYDEYKKEIIASYSTYFNKILRDVKDIITLFDILVDYINQPSSTRIISLTYEDLLKSLAKLHGDFIPIALQKYIQEKNTDLLQRADDNMINIIINVIKVNKAQSKTKEDKKKLSFALEILFPNKLQNLRRLQSTNKWVELIRSLTNRKMKTKSLQTQIKQHYKKQQPSQYVDV